MKAAKRAEHLTLLPGGAWALWRGAALRGAGFPASLLQKLASPAAAAAADQVLDGGSGPGFKATYEAEVSRIAGEIRRLAGWERFREAVAWQNYRVVERSLDRLARATPEESSSRNFQQRRDEMTVALYLQRYCAKNDTIGFFGPVGWARLDDEGDLASVRPGSRFLAQRQVYFENWAIDALAAKLAEDPEIRPWLTPRLKTGLAIDGEQLRRPGGVATPLSPFDAQLLRACDGTRTAAQLAAEFSPEDALARLEALREGGALNWTLEIPLELHPERTLRCALERIAPAEPRGRALAALDELEDGRAKVARAAGDAEALRHGMRELEEVFTRRTGLAAEHNPGMTYGARGLLYEDCRRDVEVRFGPELMRRLAPLDWVLRSARWLAGETMRRVDAQLSSVHAELRERTGANAVDSWVFFGQSIARLFPPSQRDACFGPLEAEFHARWQRVLGVAPDDGARCHRRASADLAAKLAEAFGNAGPAWELVRYFTPDVMIAARGEEALRRGECEIVLSELHASNTLLWSFFVSQHPDPDALQQALASDLGAAPLILSQVPKAKQTPRTSLAVVLPQFYRYEFADEAPCRPECRSLPAAGVVIEATPDGLRGRTRDGAVSFPARELFGIHLVLECNRLLTSLLPPWEHVPRVKIDDLVIQRETWRFPTAGLDFAGVTDAAERFLVVRRWARRHGMPRYCFYKSPAERKPCFLDLASPIYVDQFVKLVRGADRDNPLGEPLVVSEMSPDPDQVWLRDGAGESYTCELRIAAVADGGDGGDGGDFGDD